ncbi:sporulation protein YqfD [Thermoflavimicrobium dichotomicum]|uniref:Similar to stage IV sporulation protein n=1 Tax=Thermoflavimicrobium dichotomicum TaxID=46223 RepID=A0A1I3NHT9_9BACL|nr:sporulation protein YqfD [Thermoflavimicrobium dichotomicum]SFJ08904.1 similar to stage IV sporulation protein [Thermoflavimicrobium dichotomicum]
MPDIFQGKVKFVCRGEQLTAWLNVLIEHGVKAEDIYWVDKDRVELTLALPDFFRIIPFLRQYRIRIKILEKKGLPFLLQKIKRRKFFHIGFIFFIFILFAMSSFIWHIDIEGAEDFPTEHIRSILAEEGVFVGQFKYRLPNDRHLQERLLERLPEASWIGVRIEGTRAVITVVNKKKVDHLKKEQEEKGPVDLVSNKHAMIVDMQVERGRPVVDIYDVVQKGQLLVSGEYGNPEQPDTGKIVGAKGKVIGEVWYESEVTLPLIEERKEYTGQRDKVTHFFIGSKIFRNPFHRAMPLKRYETIQSMRSLYLGNWKLPFGLVDEERLEMRSVQYHRPLKEAIQLAIQRAKEELSINLGSEGRILTEKVLHQRIDNGKVYLKIHFDVLENIAVSQPILQGE